MYKYIHVIILKSTYIVIFLELLRQMITYEATYGFFSAIFNHISGVIPTKYGNEKFYFINSTKN